MHKIASAEVTGMNNSTPVCSQHLLIDYEVHHDAKSLENDWRELEKQSNISIYQRFVWISACIDTIERQRKTQAHIVTGRKNGKLVMILPLTVKNGLVPKITWIGGNHSNFNLGLFEHKFASSLKDDDIVTIFREVGNILPDFGYMKLCCQPENWGGKANPLKSLPNQCSTNVAFGMNLENGFDGLLSEGNAKRKRKKFRTQLRATDALGGAELVLAKSPEEATEMLESFHTQKTDRLHNQGIKDVFGGEDTRQFLQLMARTSLTSNEPILKLYGLKIAGKYRAICGGGVLDKHFSAYFTSFADDELASSSPGEMLLYMLVKQLAESGYHYMDLGGGEERYKRSWCPDTFPMFDIIIPLSPLSYGHVLTERMVLVVRRKVRENPILWSAFKRLRVSITKLVDRLGF